MDLGPFSNGQSMAVRNQTNIHAMDDTNWCGEDPQYGVWYKLSVNVPTEVTGHTYVKHQFQHANCILQWLLGTSHVHRSL